MKETNIKLKDISGTWYEIDRAIIYGKLVILLESEQYGEDIPTIAVDKDYNILFKDIYNGIDEVSERLEEQAIIKYSR